MACAGVLLALLTACGERDGLDEGLVGTYVLDAKGFQAEALSRRQRQGQDRLDKLGANERKALQATWRLAAAEEAKRTKMQMVLKGDGRFQTRFWFGREQMAAAGDWTRSGDHVVLTTSVENGRRLAKPYETRAAIESDAIRIQGARVSIPFTLRRVPSE